MSSIMESLLETSNIVNLKEGSIVKGIITQVRENEVTVDIGAKAEGVIPGSEFPDVSELQIGIEIEIHLEKLENKDGNPIVSYDKAQQKKNWENILTKYQEGSVISGRVKGKVKGGLIVGIGVDAFLPTSQIDTQQTKNIEQYMGQTFNFKILKISPNRKNIVLSRRDLIEEQRQQKRKQILGKIKAGDICKGVVKNITDYGAFIDLDGLDGLLHVRELSWGQVSHPSELLKIGEAITVMVIDVDTERERISLGLKQLQTNPWDNVDTKYPVGSKVTGKVVNFMPRGAFINLENGIEAFLYIGELSWTKRYSKPSEVLKIGQEIEAAVLDVQKTERKISLSLRQLEPNPWDMVQHNYRIGARVRGKVSYIEPTRVFVNLEDGIDGVLRLGDISWSRRIEDPRQVLSLDQEINAIILDVDSSKQRVVLGMKQLQEDPWLSIDRYFKLFDIVSGKVIKITSFGAFIQLQHDFEGLIPMNQISEKAVSAIKDALKVGQEVQARIIKIDREERRIGLSIKALEYDADRLNSEANAFETGNRDRDFKSLGDLLNEATR